MDITAHPTPANYKTHRPTDRQCAEAKFCVSPNGDDARVCFVTDDYNEAAAVAKALSVGHWLGFKQVGPSGTNQTFANGVRTGYRDSTKGWVAA